ncbi:hypothetical protein D9M71_799630 [compost metagenome]
MNPIKGGHSQSCADARLVFIAQIHRSWRIEYIVDLAKRAILQVTTPIICRVHHKIADAQTSRLDLTRFGVLSQQLPTMVGVLVVAGSV